MRLVNSDTSYFFTYFYRKQLKRCYDFSEDKFSEDKFTIGVKSCLLQEKTNYTEVTYYPPLKKWGFLLKYVKVSTTFSSSAQIRNKMVAYILMYKYNYLVWLMPL